MKRIVITILMFGIFQNVKAAPIESAILDYSASTTPAQMSWSNSHFPIKIGGNNPNNSSITWATYRDSYILASLSEYMAMKDFAEAKGYDYTKMVMHAKVNFTGTSNTSNVVWSQMDKFDNYEGANGVLLEPSAGTFADYTNTAYTGASITLDHNLYLGYEEPFDRANFVYSRMASGLNGSWQYWDGVQWSNLTVSDGTANMSNNGLINFTPPANWGRTSLHSSRNKYFIRYAFSSASISPIISTIKGDDWMITPGTLQCRGWSFTDSNRVNIGTPLEYNPTPPVGSTARFPYQAQIGGWGPNHSAFNSGYKPGGKRASAEFLADEIYNYSNPIGSKLVMMDDAKMLPSLLGSGIALSDTDFPDYSSNDENTESIERFIELRSNIKTIDPTFALSVNAPHTAFVNATIPDYNLGEYFSFSTNVFGTGQFAPGEYGNITTMTFDNYLPANNAGGIRGVLIYRDEADSGGNIWGSNPAIPWDMSNRGPIASLTKHLIGWNDHTIFSYHTYPDNFVYPESDQVVLKNGSTINITTAAVPQVTDVKRWATYFPAMSVDYGSPTSARSYVYWGTGSNGGTAGAWNVGSQVFGSSYSHLAQTIWRRDWSNAIVLLSPNDPRFVVTGQEKYDMYTTPSAPYDLGGTYYLLDADGNTGPGITSISLRYNEGAILMKAPLTTTTFTPIAGSCGSANGGLFPTVPTTNLCSTGSMISMAGTGPWTWGCSGFNGGAATAADACGASLQSTDIGTVILGSKIYTSAASHLVDANEEFWSGSQSALFTETVPTMYIWMKGHEGGNCKSVIRDDSTRAVVAISSPLAVAYEFAATWHQFTLPSAPIISAGTNYIQSVICDTQYAVTVPTAAAGTATKSLQGTYLSPAVTVSGSSIGQGSIGAYAITMITSDFIAPTAPTGLGVI